MDLEIDTKETLIEIKKEAQIEFDNLLESWDYKIAKKIEALEANTQIDFEIIPTITIIDSLNRGNFKLNTEDIEKALENIINKIVLFDITDRVALELKKLKEEKQEKKIMYKNIHIDIKDINIVPIFKEQINLFTNIIENNIEYIKEFIQKLISAKQIKEPKLNNVEIVLESTSDIEAYYLLKDFNFLVLTLKILEELEFYVALSGTKIVLYEPK